MQVCFWVGVVDEDGGGEIVPYSFYLPHTISPSLLPDTQEYNEAVLGACRDIPRGREREFLAWLRERGIEVGLSKGDALIANARPLDVPDHFVFEMVNAWSWPR